MDVVSKFRYATGFLIRPVVDFTMLHTSSAKSTVFGLLKNISRGHLIIDSLDETFEFGQPHVLTIDGVSRELLARIKVHDEGFWVRLFLAADLGFAGKIFVFSMDSSNMC